MKMKFFPSSKPLTTLSFFLSLPALSERFAFSSRYISKQMLAKVRQMVRIRRAKLALTFFSRLNFNIVKEKKTDEFKQLIISVFSQEIMRIVVISTYKNLDHTSSKKLKKLENILTDYFYLIKSKCHLLIRFPTSKLNCYIQCLKFLYTYFPYSH